MHSIELVSLLAGGLAAALALGLVAHRLHLPPIVGYLMAGVIVGPHTPGFVANESLSRQLAEVGVILLLFGVGLEFHPEKLVMVARLAVPAAVTQLVIVTAGSAFALHAVGFSPAGAVVMGIALSVSSTVVVTRLLAERREIHTSTGHLAVGWLLAEDLLTVLVLVLLPGLLGPRAEGRDLLLLTAMSLFKLAALIAFTLLAGGRLIPWLLTGVAATRSRELFTLSVLALALGIGLAAAELFGASMALGAFLAGLVVGRSEFAFRAASEALPMRDAFAVLFFVSVGMLFDPAFLVQRPWLVVLTLGIVLLVKPLVAALCLRMLGRPVRPALAVGVSRGQIGEFSFILGGLGSELGVLPAAAGSALVATAILSITLNPLLLKLAPRARALLPDPESKNDGVVSRRGPAFQHRAVIVGYGPVGQTVSRLLADSGIQPTIVELNLETVRALRERGQPAVYGDASRRETLEQAGLGSAIALVLSAPIEAGAEGVVRQARELNPAVYVIARAGFLAEVAGLKRAGADAACSGEGEIALAMTELVLTRLGATPEQIDRERARVHGDLDGAVG